MGIAASENREATRLAGDEEQLVVAWADFTKAAAIYPETSTRVRTALEGFVDRARAYTGAGASVAIRIESETVCVNSVELACGERGNVPWLRTQLERNALAGVTLEAGISEDTILRFTAQLLENAARSRDPAPYVEAWPDPLPHLHPRDLRFDDLHEHPADAGRRSSEGQTLYDLLATSPEIADRLDALETLLSAHVQALSGKSVTVDLIDIILNLLPIDALLDRERLEELTAGLLDSLAKELENPESSGELSRFGIEQLMLSVGRKYFSHENAQRRKLPQQTKKPTLAERDRVPADVPGLLRAASALPELAPDALETWHKHAAGELLGVYLHILAIGKDRDLAQRLQEAVRDLLVHPGPHRLECLRGNLELATKLAERGQREALDRVLTFLEDAELDPLMRKCGFLNMLAAHTHPAHLLLPYIRTVDWTVEEDVAELERLCLALGPRRITDNAKGLQRRGGLSRGGCDLQILAQEKDAFLPLAHCIIAESGIARRPQVIAFLRKLELSTREACVLHIAIDEQSIPIDLLSGLTERSANDEHTAMAASILCRFVQDTSHEEPERIRAIDWLGRFPLPAARDLLEELISSTRFLMKRETPAIRAAAERALATGKDHV